MLHFTLGSEYHLDKDKTKLQDRSEYLEHILRDLELVTFALGAALDLRKSVVTE